MSYFKIKDNATLFASLDFLPFVSFYAASNCISGTLVEFCHLGRGCLELPKWCKKGLCNHGWFFTVWWKKHKSSHLWDSVFPFHHFSGQTSLLWHTWFLRCWKRFDELMEVRAPRSHCRAHEMKDYTILALFATNYSYHSWVIFRDKRKCVPV